MATFVITGSSSGIGEACTLRLAGAGHRVIAGVRRDEDGERLAALHESIIPVSLDITDQTHIDALVDRLDELGITGLDGLVDNAGIVSGGPVEYLPLDDWRSHFEVNVFGQVAVTKALIPALRRGQGRVVFIGSISGRVSTPLVGPYGASKHAIEAIAESLREELRPWKIAVSVVEPGAVKTPIWDKSRTFADQLEGGSNERPYKEIAEDLGIDSSKALWLSQ